MNECQISSYILFPLLQPRLAHFVVKSVNLRGTSVEEVEDVAIFFSMHSIESVEAHLQVKKVNDQILSLL